MPLRQACHLADDRFGETSGFLRRARSGHETPSEGSAARFSHGRDARRTIEEAIVLGGADDALDVVLRLGKWNVVDKLVAADAGPLRAPARYAAFTCVVRRKRRRDIGAEQIEKVREVGGA